MPLWNSDTVARIFQFTTFDATNAHFLILALQVSLNERKVQAFMTASVMPTLGGWVGVIFAVLVEANYDSIFMIWF